MTTPLLPFEPSPPHVRNSPTSKAAAKAIKPKAATLRENVLDFIAWTGTFGATDEEMQTALEMLGSTQRPRRVELVEAGLVVDSGKKRKTSSGRDAVVWVAAG